MTMLDVSIVTYQPREGDLTQLADTLAENLTAVPQHVGPVTIRVLGGTLTNLCLRARYGGVRLDSLRQFLVCVSNQTYLNVEVVPVAAASSCAVSPAGWA
jgi:hypothetical protein